MAAMTVHAYIKRIGTSGKLIATIRWIGATTGR